MILSNMNSYAKEEVILNDGVWIFVSPDGKDTNSGTDETSPLKTIAKAQSKANLYKNIGEEQVTIYLREGTYEPFSIEGTAQSGKEGCKIIYENYPGEEAVITDGIVLNGSDFKSVTDEDVWKRLDQEARFRVKQYDLSGYSNNWIINEIEYGKAASIGAMLYVDNETMNIARWPDYDYAKPSDFGELTDAQTLSVTNSALINKLENEKDALLGGYFIAGWAYQTEKVKSISNSMISINDSIIQSDSRICLFNALSLLDKPNEWYIDADKKVLYFYPPYDLSESKIMLSTGNRNLINLNSASFVKIKGLTIEGTQGIGINANNSRNIEICNCRVKNITTSGISLIETFDANVFGNEIYNMGCGGITVGQFSTRNDLIDGNVIITDNEIYNFSQFVRTYTPGIALTGTGNLVKNNKIHDAPHNAIMFGFNNNIIEHNEIYRVLSETDDAGAIYAGRSWAQAGNILRYNKIYDCESYSGATIMGIYLDDMFSNTTVFENMIDGLPIGIFMGGGHFNVIENNVISNLGNKEVIKNAIYTDSRGTQNWFSSFFVFDDHKVLSNCLFIQELLQVQYLVNPAYDQYPKLKKILEKNYREPQENVIRNNISYMHGNFRIVNNVSKNGVIENNRELEEDPGFNDANNFDFTGADIPGFEGVKW